MAQAGRETEVKFHVLRLSEAAARITSHGGSLLTPRTLEQNLRFDTPDNALRRDGCALRLRRDAAARLTFKGPSSLAHGAHSRDEFETSVGDFDATCRLLGGLGFAVVFAYEKYRTTYAFERTEIMLDELPFGDFVEIEGELNLLRPAADTLGLNWDCAVVDSYHALFEKLQLAAHLPFRDLTFQNFEGRAERISDLGIIPADR